MDMFDEEWERQANEAEAECGGIVTGCLGSPDDHPIEPVLEDEATLRKFLADKFQQMLAKEKAKEKWFLENSPPPDFVFPRGVMVDDPGFVPR